MQHEWSSLWPPAVVLDPTDQCVVSGQLVSFTAEGVGTPALAVGWQARTAIDPNPNLGWVDVSGAEGMTYTFRASLEHNGWQFRAMLQSASANLESRAATLTVTTEVTPPSIGRQPEAQKARPGCYGVFCANASGTAPLRYQWFKDDLPIALANDSVLLIPAEAADVGRAYRIRVLVSNVAGELASDEALMRIDIPTSEIATETIRAAEGGYVRRKKNYRWPAIDVRPGVLSADTAVRVAVQASTVADLPPEVVPVGDVVEIGPPGLRFDKPVRLRLRPAEGEFEVAKVLGLVVLDGDGAVTDMTAQTSEALPCRRHLLPLRQDRLPRLRRLAEAEPVLGVRLQAGRPFKVQGVQSANHRGGEVVVLIHGATTVMLASVPEAMCDELVAVP
jgi:hypothetical protein